MLDAGGMTLLLLPQKDLRPSKGRLMRRKSGRSGDGDAWIAGDDWIDAGDEKDDDDDGGGDADEEDDEVYDGLEDVQNEVAAIVEYGSALSFFRRDLFRIRNRLSLV